LESRPGRQLAIVRYSPDHDCLTDWVYNAADIDGSKVVWAREMDPSNNQNLLRYYKDRKVWLVEPDGNPPRISPYPVDQVSLIAEKNSMPMPLRAAAEAKHEAN
jgi:hypothetical protein